MTDVYASTAAEKQFVHMVSNSMSGMGFDGVAEEPVPSDLNLVVISGKKDGKSRVVAAYRQDIDAAYEGGSMTNLASERLGYSLARKPTYQRIMDEAKANGEELSVKAAHIASDVVLSILVEKCGDMIQKWRDLNPGIRWAHDLPLSDLDVMHEIVVDSAAKRDMI